MSHKVRLFPQDIEFEVPAGQTILEAALNNNIRFPHRCQVGVCAMCMCKKLSGGVGYQLDPMLTEEEKRQGWILPCQAYITSDVKLTFEE